MPTPVDNPKVLKPKLGNFIISPVEVADLPAVAEGQWTAFGEATWSVLEPPSRRPSHAVRVARAVKRIEYMLNSPHIILTKASLPSGELIGFSQWQKPAPGPARTMYRKTPEQEDWAWEGMDQEIWEKTADKLEADRNEVMGDEPHWYLAPLWVLPKYQGRGVGTALLEDVVRIADATSPPTAMYLQASPSGQKLYERLGFRVVEGKADKMVRRGPV